MTDHSPRPERRGVRRLFARTSWPEARFLADMLRTETVGGALLLLGAVIALLWANSPWGDAYAAAGPVGALARRRARCTSTSIWPPGPPTACWPSSSSWSAWN